MLTANTGNTMVKVGIGEEMVYALPLRSIDRVGDAEGRFNRPRMVEVNEKEIIALEGYRNTVTQLLCFKSEDVLRVKMRINTGDHPPIKLRPY